MVGSIERVPGGARCPPRALSAPGSRRSLLLLPRLLFLLLFLPPPPRYRRGSGWRRRCHSYAGGAGAAGAWGSGRGGAGPRGTQQVELGVSGHRPPPAHHAALCHLSRPQAKILSMMEDNKQLALRIDGAVQSASQEVTNLRAELTATNRRLAELSGGGGPGPGPGAATSASAADSAAANMENHQHGAQGRARSAPRAEARRGEARRASRTRPRRWPGTRCPSCPGPHRLALWLVTLSAQRWPPLLPCWELQAAVIHENPGGRCGRGFTRSYRPRAA